MKPFNCKCKECGKKFRVKPFALTRGRGVYCSKICFNRGRMKRIQKKLHRFSSGSVRDSQDGKPNFYECLSPLAIWRYGHYMAKASAKYGEDNWTKGIPVESYMKSLERHLVKLKAELKYGIHIEEGVDHASAALFNIQGLIHELEKKKYETLRTKKGR